MKEKLVTEEIRFYGIVQGVGFRPTVYGIAKELNLKGEVSNDGQGVIIKVTGKQNTLDKFVEKINIKTPPLAKIEKVTRTKITETINYSDFQIAPSINNNIRTKIAPDAATCPSCKEEIFNPKSRWYGYGFTNCTHCGPRLSIIKKLPYDRPNTSMAEFKFCPQCWQDYSDPLHRRFHAQPTACHICGPKVWLEGADHSFSELDIFEQVAQLILTGNIVGIKGLGGFHLACDATNQTVVEKLRAKKLRPDKPFALMARDINIIAEYCLVTPKEKEILTSAAAPIVLLQIQVKKKVAASVAPGQNILGFMLPYTPIHHLIFKNLTIPIVLTSGNFADEPQWIKNEEAREKLGKIADYLLLHNREIVNRVDDSVVIVKNEKPQILRRARGYAPAPINLPVGF